MNGGIVVGGLRSKANWALAIVTTGFLASYPFSHTVAGGLVSSACGAAMVGGIADWFAITALFRRPLGISWRTELIPRNREKILSIIVDMVEQELLTTDNIKRTLGKYDLAAVFHHYLTDCGGTKQVKELLEAAAVQFVNHADKQELSRSLNIMIRKELTKLELSPLLAAAIEWSLHSGYGDKLITFLFAEGRRLAAGQQAEKLIEQVVTAALATYEQGRTRRRVFDTVAAAIMGLTPERTAKLIQQQLLQYLDSCHEPDHTLRVKVRNWLLRAAAALKQDSRIKEAIERWKQEQLARPEVVEQHIFTMIERIWSGDGGAVLPERLHRLVNSHVDEWVESFATDKVHQQQFDAAVKAVLIKWVEHHHGELGELVRQRVSRLSAEDLADFVETRAGNDLQMIRINGSVVGGVLGLILYAADRWLQ